MRFREDIASYINTYISFHQVESFIEAYIKDSVLAKEIVCDKKLVLDSNKWVTELYSIGTIAGLGTIEISRLAYNECKEHYELGDNKYADWYTGLVGKICSKNRNWFSGYNEKCYTELSNFRDELKELVGTKFECIDYLGFNGVDNVKSVIYVRPPVGRLREAYNISRSVDCDAFWEHTRELSKNNIVFVHGLMCPSDFRAVLEDNDSGERLFVHESIRELYEGVGYDF